MNSNHENTFEIRYVENRYHVLGSNYPADEDGPLIASVATLAEAKAVVESDCEPDLCAVYFVQQAYEVWLGGNPDFSTGHTSNGPDGFGLAFAEDTLEEAQEKVAFWLSGNYTGRPEVLVEWAECGPVWLTLGHKVAI